VGFDGGNLKDARGAIWCIGLSTVNLQAAKAPLQSTGFVKRLKVINTRVERCARLGVRAQGGAS